MQEKLMVFTTKYLPIILICMLSILGIISEGSIVVFTAVTILALFYAIVIYTTEASTKKKEGTQFLKLEEQSKNLEEELESLHEVSKIITSTFDVKTIIEYIYNVLKRVKSCKWCYAYFIDRSTKRPVFNCEYGNKIFRDLDELSYTQYVKTLIENGFCEETKIEVLSNENTDRVIVISLNVSEETMGVIFIASPMTEALTETNLNFLRSIACYATIGIRNAEMFNNIYTQKEEIEALYEQSAANNEELNNYVKELGETKEKLNKKNMELREFFTEMRLGYLQTVMSLANSIEAKDPYTRGHCQRVMEISCELAKALGLSKDEIEDLRYASILHDIGKIGIGANILNKKGKLTDEEFNEIKKHPVIAYNILKDVEFLRGGLDAILQHHERYDGKGYPHGLKGNNICIFARIMCVADAFDAMTSDRPYRKGMDMGEALEEIQRCKGTQFDPQVADLLVAMVRK
ncbi:MAG: HD domain-containing protein [Clostridium sp.]|nr:HD domain-containing protein [Clostridium sp.]